MAQIRRDAPIPIAHNSKSHLTIVITILAILSHPALSMAQSRTNGTGAPTGNCSKGAIYTDNTTGNLYSCNGGSWAAVAVGLAPSTPGIPTSNGNAFYVSNYGAQMDMRFDINGTYSSGSNQITTSTAAPAFVAATDNTKQIFASGNCSTTNDINCKYDCPQGTLTVVSAHVASTGGGNCTENSGATTNTNNVIWCHDDSTPVSNAFAAALASSGTSSTLQLNSPSYLVLPGGAFCIGSTAMVATSAQAARTWPLDIIGNNTVIVPLPKIPGNTQGGSYPATYGYVIADAYQNGVVGQLGTTDVWKDFTIWCGGTDVPDSSATFSNNISVVYMGGFLGRLDNVIVNGCVWNRPLANVTYGISLIGGTMTNSGAGAGGNFSCFLAPASTFVPSVMQGGSCGSSAYNSLTISNNGSACPVKGTAVSTYGTLIVQPNSPGSSKQLYGIYNAATGCTWHDYGSVLEGVYNDANGTTYLDGSSVKNSGTMAAVDLNGGNILFHNVSFTGGLNMAGGTMTFLGGNGVVNGAGSLFPFPLGYALTGGTFVFYKDVSGTCTGTVPSGPANVGFYGTGANITATACNTTIGNGQVMDASGTLALLQCFAGTGGLNGTSGVCTVIKNGSTTALTCTLGTGTSCVDTTHTVTFAINDRISAQVTSVASDTLANVGFSVGTQW